MAASRIRLTNTERRSPEEIKADFTRNWLTKAEDDFRTAVHLGRSGMDFAHSAAFHAQQAAEKFIKAWLVWEQIEFPKTHDIAALLLLIGQKRMELANALHYRATGLEIFAFLVCPCGSPITLHSP